MFRVVEMLRSRDWLRAIALTLMTVGLAACSSDASRFNGSLLGANSSSEATGSIAQGQGSAGRVESQPVPPQSAQAQPVPSGATRVAAAGRPESAGSVVRKGGAGASWSWDGGKAITVGPRDTIDAIARRNGVPASAIIEANNLRPPATIYPGQRLVIPRYTASRVASAAAPIGHRAAPAPVAASSAGPHGVHVVAAGDTLAKISRLYHKSINEIARANNIDTTATLNVGEHLVIPGLPTAGKSASLVSAAPVTAKPVAAAPVKQAEPVQNASVVTPADSLAKDAAKLAEGTGALPKFRWPANGRIIAGYGPTTNGQQNDGINIALPENTPVKAAEDGVVAYAGNELKGYGNLVLVRHPNGYVTAYAHAKELLVKRGDQVKRGQVIALSGQTGNVNAPQLHFEIRKGASPLDPTRFLNGA
ncbi:MAG TPA: peptidoglycan DD-metalloendopeptidase family protein [Xanthobacteraceae bacterium]|jgi:murein DD-endopeptidase MepM/ murein hydrolase activator NlpD